MSTAAAPAAAPAAPPVPSVPEVPTASSDGGKKKKNGGQVRLNPPEGGFTEVPIPEWNSSKHVTPKKTDFAKLSLYHQWQLWRIEEMAKPHREMLELIKIHGEDAESLKKARSVQRTTSQFKELVESKQVPIGDLKALLEEVPGLKELLASA